MKVYQVPASALPALAAILDVLRALPRSIPSPVGDLAADLAAGPPVADVPTPGTRLAATINPHAFDRARGPFRLRAAWYCPPGGGIGWHTNSNAPGWRAYVVRSPGGRSGMLLPEGGVTDRDGWVNLFWAGPGTWHAVRAETERWSAGVRLPEATAEGVIRDAGQQL